MEESVKLWFDIITEKIEYFRKLGKIGFTFSFKTYELNDFRLKKDEEKSNFKQRIIRFQKVKQLLEEKYGENIIITCEKSFWFKRYLNIDIKFY